MGDRGVRCGANNIDWPCVNRWYVQSDGLLSNFVVKRNVFRWFALLAAGLVGEPSATGRLLCPTGSPVLTQTALKAELGRRPLHSPCKAAHHCQCETVEGQQNVIYITVMGLCPKALGQV